MDSILYSQAKYLNDLILPIKVIRHSQILQNEKHFHDFYELVIVVDGSGRHMTDYQSYPIARGDVFVVKPFTSHTYENSHKLKIENVLFCLEGLQSIYNGMRELSGFLALFEPEPTLLDKDNFKSHLMLNHNQMAILMRSVLNLHYELENQGGGFRFMATAYFMQIIGYICRCYTNAPANSYHKLSQVSRMIDFMEKNYQSHITLKNIAEKGSMSMRTANRLFKDALQMTPIDYLLRVRISEAKVLFEKKQCTISEAAFQCGFNDSNYFSKQFKKIIGKSPRDYKAYAAKKKSAFDVRSK